jgi:hypothetical protein
MAILNLSSERTQFLKFWLPPLIGGIAAFLIVLQVGSTPIVRAAGLALVIVGMIAALRRMGSGLAIIGGLALALSPEFWSQTGGRQGEPATIVIAVAISAIAVILVALVSKRPEIGVALGIIIFALLFWSQIGTPRSIRLTGFVTGWIMFLVIDMLLLTNPRPDDAPLILLDGKQRSSDNVETARTYHTAGILLLLAIGIVNDAVLTLLAPALILGLFLTRTEIPFWYWLLMGIVIGIGVRGIWVDYLQLQFPSINLWGWRDARRWIDMIQIVVGQLSVAGIILGVLGMARMARWYPVLGIVSLLAYGAYWIFGLIYSGPNRTLLLLPVYIIQIVWMTYAVLALSEWAANLTSSARHIGRYLVIAAYAILPCWFFIRIITG